MMRSILSVLVLGAVLGTSVAFADSIPPCADHGQDLPVNNQQVLQWKASTPNQFRARGHIQGALVQEYPDQTGHHHYEVQIGPNSGDTIEVIYNESFGSIPTPEQGASFEVCGDYITSNRATGHYPASPDGAILHWVHASNSPSHDDGYVAIDGVVYGQGSGSGD